MRFGCFCVAFLLLAAIAPGHAQSWSRTFEDGGVFDVHDDGRIVVASAVEMDNFTDDQMLITVLAPSGEVLSFTGLGYSFYEVLDDVVFLPDGAIAVAVREGTGSGHLAGASDFSVIVFEPDLTVRWQNTLNSVDPAYYGRLIPQPDASVTLIAWVNPASGGGSPWIVDFDASGNVVSQRAWEDDSTIQSHAVAPTGDGGFVVSGYDWNGQDQDVFLVRFDETGSPSWSKRYGVLGSQQNEISYAVDVADDGSIYIGAVTNSFGGVADDWLMLKTDASGTLLWARVVDGAVTGATTNDLLFGVASDDNGAIFVGARPDAQDNRVSVALKLDAAGALVWGRSWPEFGNSFARDVLATPEGGWLFSTDQTFSQPAVFLRMTNGGLVGAGCEPGFDSLAFPVPVSLEVADVPLTARDTAAVPTTLTLDSAALQPVELDDCIGPPGEVSRPGSSTPLIFTSATQLAWEDGMASNADSFDLYRGDLEDVVGGSNIACLQPGLVDTFALDVAVPTLGRGFAYLVGGQNLSGLGTLGSDSAGGARSFTACP